MGILCPSSARSALAGSCVLLFACSIASRSGSQERPESSSGGCGGGGGLSSSGGGNVSGPPDKGPGNGAPSDPAPTGQGWKPVETDEGCGRSGLSYVLVDEVCADGEGTDPKRLEAPMFRDGALVNGQLLAVDATHLWSLDVSNPTKLGRTSLLTGIGQPIAVGASGSRLVVAAGSEGVVFVDAADPSLPKRSASLLLPGPAFDVAIDGTKAFVAMGAAGVGEVDISGASPTLTRTLPVPGHHTAAVTTDATNVYVAACTTFSIYDRATGGLKSSVPFPKVGDRLFTPAKDVALVGNVAFIAAGKQGAVAIDVSEPKTPKVLGRCGVNAESFYASGVRAEGDQVYVAGGEWGVLKINAKDPKTACIQNMLPPPPKEPPATCSEKPPWEIVPWDRVWAPPPPAKDPIQVLPSGDKVYAFGDARRIGVRAVDVRNATDLELVRRYDEPRTVLGIAVKGSRIVTVGPKGGAFATDPTKLVVRAPATGDDALVDASQVQLLPDGRWVALRGDKVYVEGRSLPIAQQASAIAVRDADVVVARGSSSFTAKIEDFGGTDFISKSSTHYGQNAALPLSIAAAPDAVIYAAPEWTAAMKRTATGGMLGVATQTAHEIFTKDDVLDVSLWRKRVPRRHVSANVDGLLELVVLGSQAGLAIHKWSGAIQRAPLPALTYAGLTADATHAYAIAVDRSLYKSYLVTVALGAAPQVVSLETFTGAASGIAAEGGKVYVADADGAIRVYGVNGNIVAPLGAVRVEDRP